MTPRIAPEQQPCVYFPSYSWIVRNPSIGSQERRHLVQLTNCPPYNGISASLFLRRSLLQLRLTQSNGGIGSERTEAIVVCFINQQS